MTNPVEDGLNRACVDVTITEHFGAYVEAIMSGDTVDRKVNFLVGPNNPDQPLGQWVISAYTQDNRSSYWDEAHLKLKVTFDDAANLGRMLTEATNEARHQTIKEVLA